MVKSVSPYFIVVNWLCLLIIVENLSAQNNRINDHFTWVKQPYLELPQGNINYVTKDGYASIVNNHKYGLIDFDGNMQVNMISDEPLSKKGLIPVKNKNGIGLINLKGDTVFPCKAFSYKYIEPGFYTLSVGGDELIFREDGSIMKTEFPVRSINDYTFRENAIAVEVWLNNHTETAGGYIDTAGNSLMEFKYRYNDHFEHDIAAVRSLDYIKNSYIDKKGNVVFACPDDWISIRSFDGPLALVQVGGNKGNYFGFIDRNFKLVVEPQFSASTGPWDRFYIVSKNGSTGAIDSIGKTVIPFEFSYINSFTANKRIVSKIFFKKQYKNPEQLWAFENTYTKHGIYDITKNALTIPLEYDYLEYGGKDILIAKRNDKYAYLDGDGKPLSAFEFERPENFITKGPGLK